MELAAGTVLNEQVTLLRPLGKGGMGSVWVASHTVHSGDVAVKLSEAQDPTSLARFDREAALASTIEHPHVVRMLDHGATTDGRAFIVMELLAGESLEARLQRDERIRLGEVSLLVTQLAHALSCAHGLGIVHRDIKPSNVLLLEGGSELYAKLLDFGVAKQAGGGSNLTATGSTIGTPHYMSPEQLFDTKAVDQRADLWSLAVVVYRALTGALPFAGKNLTAVSFAVRSAQFTPASALCAKVPGAEVPPGLDAWFKLALCRNIALRPSSAEALLESFRSAL